MLIWTLSSRFGKIFALNPLFVGGFRVYFKALSDRCGMLSDLLSIFVSEGSAARLLREVRRSGGVRCVYCGSLSVICWGWYRGVYRRYRCKSCLRTFNDKSGTDFEYSRIPLNERLFIMYLSGCLIVPLSRASIDVGRGYGSVYRSFRRIMCSVRRYVRRYWRVSGAVEVDEAYVDAGLKGRGNRGRIMLLGRGPRCRGLRAGRGRGGWDKDVIPVFTIVGRNGHEVYIPSRDVSGESVARIASRRVEAGSSMYTDSFPSYSILQNMGYRHDYVNHSLREYARGEVHINNCEKRASLLRPWLSVHGGISKDNPDTYLSLFQSQRNINKLPTITNNGLRANPLFGHSVLCAALWLNSYGSGFLLFGWGPVSYVVMALKSMLYMNALSISSASIHLGFLERRCSPNNALNLYIAVSAIHLPPYTTILLQTLYP
jgi:transposase-like protein